MSLYEILYVDSFSSADGFLVHQISLDKGPQSCIHKEQLVALAREKGIPVYSNTKKRELVETLYRKMEDELLCHCNHVGVHAFPFMLRYALLPGEVEDFAAAGLLERTGELKVSDKKGNRYITLYSAYQYFGIDRKTISEWRKIIHAEKD